MANIPPIQFKRSHTPSSIPTADQLEVAELAINFPDGSLYSKDSDGNVISLGGGSGGDVYTTEAALHAVTPANGTQALLTINDKTIHFAYNATDTRWETTDPEYDAYTTDTTSRDLYYPVAGLPDGFKVLLDSGVVYVVNAGVWEIDTTDTAVNIVENSLDSEAIWQARADVIASAVGTMVLPVFGDTIMRTHQENTLVHYINDGTNGEGSTEAQNQITHAGSAITPITNGDAFFSVQSPFHTFSNNDLISSVTVDTTGTTLGTLRLNDATTTTRANNPPKIGLPLVDLTKHYVINWKQRYLSGDALRYDRVFSIVNNNTTPIAGNNDIVNDNVSPSFGYYGANAAGEYTIKQVENATSGSNRQAGALDGDSDALRSNNTVYDVTLHLVNTGTSGTYQVAFYLNGRYAGIPNDIPTIEFGNDVTIVIGPMGVPNTTTHEAAPMIGHILVEEQTTAPSTGATITVDTTDYFLITPVLRNEQWIKRNNLNNNVTWHKFH